MTAKHDGIAIDPELVRTLAELLAETGLTEIEVEDGSRKLRLSRAATAVAATVAAPAAPAPVISASAAAAPVATAPVDASPSNAVKSPMVGTAYLSPEPGAAPFVPLGSTVTAGDTIMIIEAMKVMNPITAPTSGKLTQMLVDNGQPVEFDQPLFVIA